MGRALRFQGNLAASYLMNRTSSSLLNYKSSYEVLFGAPSVFLVACVMLIINGQNVINFKVEVGSVFL